MSTTIDESALKSSLEASERRLAASRQRRKQQGQRTILLAVLVLVVVPLGIFMGVAAARAPEAPSLALVWPQSGTRQIVANGGTVLIRSGQPFELGVTSPADWDVTWTAAGQSSTGAQYKWIPDAAEARVTAQCRPIAQGTMRYFAFLWPTRRLKLTGIEATQLEGQLRTVKDIPGGVWVAPRVFAAGTATWDERAISLLGPLTPPDAPTADMAEKPTPAFWQVVGDFAGDTTIAAGDGATYLKAHTPDLENNLPLLANRLITRDPRVSLKFIIRLDKNPQEGIFRVAYDGKSERRAWVRRPGEASGGPLEGWMKRELPGNLAPSLPSTASLDALAEPTPGAVPTAPALGAPGRSDGA